MDKIELSEQDALAFVEALDNPPEPNDKFIEAAKKYAGIMNREE